MTKISRKSAKTGRRAKRSRQDTELRGYVVLGSAAAAGVLLLLMLFMGGDAGGGGQARGSAGNAGRRDPDAVRIRKPDDARARVEEVNAERRLRAMDSGEGGGGSRGGGKKKGKGKHGRGPLILKMEEALTDIEADPGEREIAELMLSASLHLVGLQFQQHFEVNEDSYERVVGVFCGLDFGIQEESPPDTPMFRDLVKKSECQESFKGGEPNEAVVYVDLLEAATLSRKHDADVIRRGKSIPRALGLGGAVFHESRCGSTLAANAMLATDPSRHRVYSESSPPMMVMGLCGEDYSRCPPEAVARLLKDAVYLMSRTNDPKKEQVFFKFQSAMTRNLKVFRLAFPTTPWIFMYRDPVQVMMSQLDLEDYSLANCVKSKSKSTAVADLVSRRDYDMEELDDEEFCAVHLATLCDSAVKNLEHADGMGLAVRYSTELVDVLLDDVFHDHFKLELGESERERVRKISETYSKNRGREGEFEEDSEEKERKASHAIKAAAELFLEPSFEALETSQYNVANL